MEAEEDLSIPSSNPANWSLVDLLNIDLVRNKLFSFLNFQDLKFFSEVSKGTLKAVRKSKEFWDKATLVIGKDAVEKDFASVKALCSESSWQSRKLRIDAFIPIETLQALEMETLLMNLESVKIYKSGTKTDTTVANFLTYVLEKARRLEGLGLEPLILANKFFPDIILKEKVSSNLKNLGTLEIQYFRSAPEPKQSMNNLEALQMCMSLVALEKAILGVENLKKLVINLGKVDCSYTTFRQSTEAHKSPSLKGLVGIIKNNWETLEELQLHSDILKVAEIGNIHIPKLKRLALLIPKIEGTTIQQFLTRHGQIDHLDVSIGDRFPSQIMRVIKENMLELKSLRIKVKLFCNDEGQRRWDDNYGENILSFIPATVEAVGLQGCQSLTWRPTIFQRQERNIWQRLSHLTNLTELDLDWSRDALNDRGLQDLILDCPNLKAIAFSHCRDVTNFGVTGVDSNGERSGVSLDELTCLQSLSVRSCPGIDKDKLFSVVKFRSLRRFCYHEILEVRKRPRSPVPRPKLTLLDYMPGPSSRYWTGQAEIAQLRSQNPCLQELSVRLPFPDGIHFAEVGQLRGRLTIFKRELSEQRSTRNDESFARYDDGSAY